MCEEGQVYYDCILLRKIGNFESRTIFSYINFDIEKMILEFFIDYENISPNMVKSFRLCE